MEGLLKLHMLAAQPPKYSEDKCQIKYDKMELLSLKVLYRMVLLTKGVCRCVCSITRAIKIHYD